MSKVVNFPTSDVAMFMAGLHVLQMNSVKFRLKGVRAIMEGGVTLHKQQFGDTNDV